MNRLQNWLDGIGASKDLIDLAGSRTLQRLWDECDRGDQMLWLLRRMAGKPGWPTVQTVVGLCCDCAELAKNGWRLHAPAKCIATARAWCRGEGTIYDVYDAANAAAAAAGLAAPAYSVYSAYAASFAAAAAYSECAHLAATYVACAISSEGVYKAIYNTTLMKCANIIRAAIPTLPDIPQEGGES